MTTLTVHLEENLLKQTLEMAEARHATVDDIVADALKEVSARWSVRAVSDESEEGRRRRLEAALIKFSNFQTGGPYTREMMNER